MAVRNLDVKPAGTVTLLYARPLSDVDHTLARVQVFLLLGVLGGTILALLAGLATAQRAMRPIAGLTDAAREIERTRDATGRLPHPEAEDEIAELARTLEGMLASLDSARRNTQAMLDRQREFVADASHELRTPLTSVLANLELLTEELEGEQAETAEAALRSTRRMRRLVGDLLLLARADARRVQPHRPTNVAEVLIEAAAELGPMAERHELSIAAEPVVVEGVRDELHRLVLNLLENAVRHTPPGTRVSAGTTRIDDEAVITVEDDGPGISPELEHRVFERFVRGGRDGGRGSGLGLAIVRAVAQFHGGTVALERPEVGYRDPLRDPDPGGGRRGTGAGPAGGGSDLDDYRQDHRAPPQPLVDELGEIVVQLLLEQVDLSDAPLRGPADGALDRIPDVGHQVVGLVDERHAAEDDLGRSDRLPGLLGDGDHHDEDPVGGQHPAVAQGHVGRVADVDAIDEDHSGALGLAEAGAAGVELERQAVLAAEHVIGIDPDRVGELSVQTDPLMVAVYRHHVTRAHQVEHQLQLLDEAVPGSVDRAPPGA